MATASREEQILEAITTRLRGITAGSVYWYTPGLVTRDRRTPEETTAYPAYGVVEGELRRRWLTGTAVLWTLPVTIAIWAHSDRLHGPDRRTVLVRCTADLVRAVYTDDTWGGLALVTSVARRVTDDGSQLDHPLAYGELQLEVHYVGGRDDA